MSPDYTPSDVIRFWSKVDICEDDRCWNWCGSIRGNSGYGQFYVGGKRNYKQLSSHRVAWEFYNNQFIPEKMLVCHSCDNRLCCNPKHLFLGSQADNIQDMISKNRQATKERHGRAKINMNIANEIRQRYAAGGQSQDELAKEYGINQTTAGRIVRNEIWIENYSESEKT